MSPQEIMSLPAAPLGDDGNPRCHRCASATPAAARRSLSAAPVMVVDEQQPALCMCPKCGGKAQTPTILAVAILAMRIAAAVAEEREACAKEADDESRRCTGDRAAVDIADAIRTRGVR